MSNYKIIATGITILLILIVFKLGDESTQKSLSPRVITPNQNEIILIYFGSSNCGPCNDERLSPVVTKLIEVFKKKTDSLGVIFRTIGVANDIFYQDGLDHLEKIARFDEIASGNGFLNVSVNKYMIQNSVSNSTTATPQIVVLKRFYRENAAQNITIDGFKILDEQIIDRRIGIISIFILSKEIRNGLVNYL